jgi:hypothetical protein
MWVFYFPSLGLTLSSLHIFITPSIPTSFYRLIFCSSCFFFVNFSVLCWGSANSTSSVLLFSSLSPFPHYSGLGFCFSQLDSSLCYYCCELLVVAFSVHDLHLHFYLNSFNSS